jgi:hypothetical protein
MLIVTLRRTWAEKQLLDGLAMVSSETHPDILESSFLRHQSWDHVGFRGHYRLGLVMQLMERATGTLKATDGHAKGYRRAKVVYLLV